jgi:hypothetical protein
VFATSRHRPIRCRSTSARWRLPLPRHLPEPPEAGAAGRHRLRPLRGFYVGTWASTIKWIKDAGGDGSVEIDLYGGYKTEIAPGLTVDVGVLQYYYPQQARPAPTPSRSTAR